MDLGPGEATARCSFRARLARECVELCKKQVESEWHFVLVLGR